MLFQQISLSLLRSSVRSLSASASPPASVWSLGKLNHVAIAVPNLEAATALYRDMLGATVSQPQVRISPPPPPPESHKYFSLTPRIFLSTESPRSLLNCQIQSWNCCILWERSRPLPGIWRRIKLVVSITSV